MVRASGYTERGSEAGALETPESFPYVQGLRPLFLSVGRPLGEPHVPSSAGALENLLE